LEFIFHGEAGHSAIHSEPNAIVKACKFVSKVEATKQPYILEKYVKDMISGMASELELKGAYLLKLLLNPFTAPLALKIGGKRFESTFSPLMRTIVSVTGVYTEKLTSNIIPSEASVKLSIRLLPSDNRNRLYSSLLKLAGPDVTVNGEIGEAKADGVDTSQLSLIRKIVSWHFSDTKVVPMMLPGSTDARHFSKLGIQTYGFLPMRLPHDLKFMTLIHSANERCPVDALVEGSDILVHFIKEYRG